MHCKVCKRKEPAAALVDHYVLDLRKLHSRPVVTARRKSKATCNTKGLSCQASIAAPSKLDEAANVPEDSSPSSWAQELHSRIISTCSQYLSRVEPDTLSGAGLVVVLALWFSAIVTANILPGILFLGILIAWGAAVDLPAVQPPPPASWPAAAALLGAAAVTWWNLVQSKLTTARAQVRGLGAELKPARLLNTLLKRGGIQRKLEAEQLKDLAAQLKEMKSLVASMEEREAKLKEMMKQEKANLKQERAAAEQRLKKERTMAEQQLKQERTAAEEQLKQKDVELGELRTRLESTVLQLEGIEKVHEQELKALKTDIRIKEQQLQSLVKSSGQQSELLLKLEAQAAANAKLRSTMNTFEKQMVMVRTSLKEAKVKQVKAELLNSTYENQVKDLQQEVAKLKRERSLLVEQMQDLYKHSTGLVKAYSNGSSW